VATIHTQIEQARGCGYRKKGGKYLMSDGVWTTCGIFPIQLDLCPCCGHGIKFTRSFSWFTKELIAQAKCNTKKECGMCSPFFDDSVKKFGLLWTGGQYYPTPTDFLKEANMAGLSKRINTIPKDLVLGETWIMLAHNKAITILHDEKGELLPEPIYKKGIFAAFVPTRLEYIVKGTETEEELDRLEKQGYKLIQVIEDVDAQTDINDQLEDYDVDYYKKGDRNKHTQTVKACSDESARQVFKKLMNGEKVRIMSIDKA
jgi:hypothetical protein